MSKLSKRTTIIAFASAALIGLSGLVSSTAFAGPGGPDGRRGPGFAMSEECRTQMFQQKLAAFDRDGDGQLSRDERRAMREQKKAQALADFDANGDGRLDREERKALHVSRASERFGQIDANGDDQISQDEAQNSCSPLSAHFDEIDTNEDGVIKWKEFSIAAKAHMAHRKLRKAERRMRGQRGAPRF